MPSENQSPREIEREIETERAELKDTISDLQDNLSIEGVVRQATSLMRDNGGEIGRSISRSVKQNPLALAVTGVGLAWLIFGSEQRSSMIGRAIAASATVIGTTIATTNRCFVAGLQVARPPITAPSPVTGGRPLSTAT